MVSALRSVIRGPEASIEARISDLLRNSQGAEGPISANAEAYLEGDSAPDPTRGTCKTAQNRAQTRSPRPSSSHDPVTTYVIHRTGKRGFKGKLRHLPPKESAESDPKKRSQALDDEGAPRQALRALYPHP